MRTGKSGSVAWGCWLGIRKVIAAGLFRHQFIRYGISGGLTAAIYFALVAALVEGLAAPIAVASAVGLAVAVPANFLLHKLWSFDSTRRYAEATPRYLAALGVSYSFNLVAVNTLVSWLDIGVILAQFIASPAFVICNYVVLKAWVFAVPAVGQIGPGAADPEG